MVTLVVHYVSNEKAWMRTEIMENVLKLLDRKVQLERRKIILFLDNAHCHLNYYYYGSTEEAHGGAVRCFSPRYHIMPKWAHVP